MKMGSELNDSCHNLQICFCGDVMAHLKGLLMDMAWPEGRKNEKNNLYSFVDICNLERGRGERGAGVQLVLIAYYIILTIDDAILTASTGCLK